MGVKTLIRKLNKVFSVSNKKRRDYKSIEKLVEKLRLKEEKIKNKLAKERDELKRKKQQSSLSVIRAQLKKAHRLLGT